MFLAIKGRNMTNSPTLEARLAAQKLTPCDKTAANKVDYTSMRSLMADDTRDKETAPVSGAAPAPAAVGGTATEPSQKYPKGVVLGKDGKP